MSKTKLMLLCLLTVFALTTAVYAEENQNQTNPAREKVKDRLSKELNLAPEQQAKLDANRKAQHEKMIQLRKAMGEKEAKLREALKVPGVTKSSVEPIANEIKSLQAQLIENRIDSILAVRQILTPEQALKFDQMAEKHKKNRGEKAKGWRERQKCSDKAQ